MNEKVEFTLNGKATSVTTDGRRSLLDVLREDLGLTGTKYGCGEGQCHACNVLIDGEPIASCLTQINLVANRDVRTIESLSSNGKLHPVQKAFLDAGAMQCGYCVPGMIMTAVALLKKNPNPSREEIVEGMNGNLCRCCGYTNIIEAVRLAANGKGGT
jgi:aerobic-type carbon monoxide dehydrogenase small subunit (CoxS/CutS family)